MHFPPDRVRCLHVVVVVRLQPGGCDITTPAPGLGQKLPSGTIEFDPFPNEAFFVLSKQFPVHIFKAGRLIISQAHYRSDTVFARFGICCSSDELLLERELVPDDVSFSFPLF